MADTLPGMNAKMIEMMRKKTPAERLMLGCSMFDFSKELVVSSILRENPALSPALLQRELFLRFYGAEFNSSRREKIGEYLTQKYSKK